LPSADPGQRYSSCALFLTSVLGQSFGNNVVQFVDAQP
jgi:hypothetical protein